MKAIVKETGETIDVCCLYPVTYSRLDCNGKIVEEYNEDELTFTYDDKDTIDVTPRESYLIMDCLSFVLGKMDKEKIDYLYCNYSVDEIAKCAQRFGKMNLKNQW